MKLRHSSKHIHHAKRARILGVSGALSLIAIVALPGVSLGRLDVRPEPVAVTIRGVTVRATAGDFCLRSQESESAVRTVCADAHYPLPVRGRLPARPGRWVTFDTTVEATRVEVGLIRLKNWQKSRFVGRARRRNDDGTRWRIRLPKRLRGAEILNIDVKYPNGEANFWAGIRSKKRCQPKR